MGQLNIPIPFSRIGFNESIFANGASTQFVFSLMSAVWVSRDDSSLHALNTSREMAAMNMAEIRIIIFFEAKNKKSCTTAAFNFLQRTPLIKVKEISEETPLLFVMIVRMLPVIIVVTAIVIVRL